MRSPGTGVRDICTLDPLELELQAVVSHSVQVLGTEVGSSERAVGALDY